MPLLSLELFFLLDQCNPVGQLLELVCEAQGSGELKTREEALSYIRQYLAGKGSKNDQKK